MNGCRVLALAARTWWAPHSNEKHSVFFSIQLSTCPGDCEGQQQYNTYGDEEPVYEEIQSRTTENCDANDYDDGGTAGGECSAHPVS